MNMPFVGYKTKDEERIRLEEKFNSLLHEDVTLGKTVSFVGNKSVPILRLYRYKEAFGFEFVRHFIKRLQLSSVDYVFDPFAGMGTTLFASMFERIKSIGVDKLPLAAFVAQSINVLLFRKKGELISAFEKLKSKVDHSGPAPVAMDVPIMRLAFDDDLLFRLRQWKSAIETISSPLYEVFVLLFLSILEKTSYTSKDGQFLRLRRDKRPLHPDEALYCKVVEAENDLDRIRALFPKLNKLKPYIPRVILGDTKELSDIPFEQAPTAIITSPPYVNRYDYTRSYCLELCFHFVQSFNELKALRFSILRSHIESKVSAEEKPSHPAVEEIVNVLSKKKLNNPRIPVMLVGYFNDMEKAIREWSRVLAPKAQVALVVDNVRFEGELIPVDLVLSELAENYGFYIERIIVARYKGNSSQQMKKYGRTPVRESVVIWRKL